MPFSILLPAFVTSELKTAFQIGFMLFLPFLVIDLVVSSVLMSLGMMMMSPTLVSLPFKLLLFVLVDGWALLMGSLAASFEWMDGCGACSALADRMLWVTALVAAPILIASLAVGLVVGLVQAATSVNEQTLTFVPKLAAIALVLVLLGAGMMVLLADFALRFSARFPRSAHERFRFRAQLRHWRAGSGVLADGVSDDPDRGCHGWPHRCLARWACRCRCG